MLDKVDLCLPVEGKVAVWNQDEVDHFPPFLPLCCWLIAQ